MTTSVPLVLAIDNTDDEGNVSPAEQTRTRTIDLLFDPLPGGAGYEVILFGSAFADGGGLARAELRRRPGDVQAAIDQLLDQWQQHVIQLKVERGREYVRPYETVPAEDDEHAIRLWDATGRTLARVGDTLFRYLFYTGDSQLAAIGDAVAAALREQEQVISIHSETLIAPWPMLYVPPDPGTLLHRADASWSAAGFWGYKHLVEHQVSRCRNFRNRIPLAGDGTAEIGMNVDPGLDDQFPRFPFIAPVRRFLETRAQVAVRTRKEDLAVAIAETSLTEHVMYFGCHGTSGRSRPDAPGSRRSTSLHPALYLGDGDAISVPDLASWISRRPDVPGPIVYLAACEAGRIASFFFSSFGMTMLESFANCLIGPQIDLPMGFAKEYTCRFFDALLTPGTRVGDITRDLAREFIDRHHTPLGLIFTLHRGLDVHLERAAP